MSNLPNLPSTDSADATKKYFDNYFVKNLSFTSNQVDAVTAFFEKRGFDKEAAISVASILLYQAKIDNVKVFQLLDTLGGLDPVDLSTVVTQVLNAARGRTSEIGFKIQTTNEYSEARNIENFDNI